MECIGCGCTDDDCRQCVEAQREPCHWVSDGKCSRCFSPDGLPKTSEALLAVSGLPKELNVREGNMGGVSITEGLAHGAERILLETSKCYGVYAKAVAEKLVEVYNAENKRIAELEKADS